ncbi:MAG: hypothetical protein LBR38_05655, partial [Synergistaceae bacterium]|nr:hypothetical protein [Synergistaceae bacterium]
MFDKDVILDSLDHGASTTEQAKGEVSFDKITATDINSTDAYAFLGSILNEWVDSKDGNISLDVTATRVPAGVFPGSPSPDPSWWPTVSWDVIWTGLANISTKRASTINVTFIGNTLESADELLKLLSSPDSLVSFDSITVDRATIKLPATVDVGSLNVYAASVDLTAFTTKSALTSKLGGKVTFSSWYLAPDLTVVFSSSLDVSGAPAVAKLLKTLAPGLDMEATIVNVQGINGIDQIPTQITRLDVPDVRKPVSGDHPVFTVNSDQYYADNGEISWTPALSPDVELTSADVFVEGVAYTADIFLNAKTGYTFMRLDPGLFSVDGVSVDRTQSTDGSADIHLVVSFDRTGSGDVDIRPVTQTAVPVEAPAVGASQDVSIETVQYTGTVAWDPNDDPFKWREQYTATITLTAAKGYTFNGVPPASFDVDPHPDGTSVSAKLYGSQMVVTAAYPATCVTVDVNSIGIPSTPPVWGQKAEYAITPTAEYSGSVVWNNLDPSGVFKPATVYTAKITLTAQDGYTFDGVPQDWFKVTGAVNTENSANSGVVTATFPITGNGMSAASASIITDAISEDLAKVLG